MTSPPPDAPDFSELDEISTTRELSVYLKIPEGTLDQWASRGGGPEFTKVGRHRRYHRDDVRDWWRRHKQTAIGEVPAA